MVEGDRRADDPWRQALSERMATMESQHSALRTAMNENTILTSAASVKVDTVSANLDKLATSLQGIIKLSSSLDGTIDIAARLGGFAKWTVTMAAVGLIIWASFKYIVAQAFVK